MNQLAPVVDSQSASNSHSDPSHPYIFNESNLLHYEMASMQTMSLIHQAIRRAKRFIQVLTTSSLANWLPI